MRVINWINYVLYSALWKLVRYLPEGIAYKVFESLAGISYRRNGKRVQRLRSNYRHVAPDVSAVELEEMVKDGLRSAMRYWCDTFRISDWSTEKTLQSTATNNENFLFEPIEKKRGVIVAVPHAGNWDHAGAYFCAKGARVSRMPGTGTMQVPISVRKVLGLILLLSTSNQSGYFVNS